MVTEVQVIANRKNGLRGGPKTADGKLISSQNAIRHGFLAQHVLIKGERADDLDAFRESIYSIVNPEGALEELFVEKLIGAAWRLRRIVKVEGEIFEEEDSYDQNIGPRRAFDSASEQLLTLMRYEANIEKSFYRALHELQLFPYNYSVWADWVKMDPYRVIHLQCMRALGLSRLLLF